MKDTVDPTPLAVLAALSSTEVEALITPSGRALAILEVVKRRKQLAWVAKGTTVAIVWSSARDYGVTVNGVEIKAGTSADILDTLKQLAAELEVARLQPTPTARVHAQFGCWADVQNGRFMYYPMYTDGDWYTEPLEVEYACQHMLNQVNADFGTEFTMDDFEEGDECDECTRARLKL